ncbi:MAG: hypothetical protein JRJ87_25100 [Deltaproteobacteria bacterium]|nr:hypothetical protein [Deltaproteobacteria bacterium]
MTTKFRSLHETGATQASGFEQGEQVTIITRTYDMTYWVRWLAPLEAGFRGRR